MFLLKYLCTSSISVPLKISLYLFNLCSSWNISVPHELMSFYPKIFLSEHIYLSEYIFLPKYSSIVDWFVSPLGLTSDCQLLILADLLTASYLCRLPSSFWCWLTYWPPAADAGWHSDSDASWPSDRQLLMLADLLKSSFWCWLSFWPPAADPLTFSLWCWLILWPPAADTDWPSDIQLLMLTDLLTTSCLPSDRQLLMLGDLLTASCWCWLTFWHLAGFRWPAGDCSGFCFAGFVGGPSRTFRQLIFTVSCPHILFSCFSIYAEAVTDGVDATVCVWFRTRHTV